MYLKVFGFKYLSPGGERAERGVGGRRGGRWGGYSWGRGGLMIFELLPVSNSTFFQEIGTQ